MKSFVSRVFLASLVLSTLIGADTSYAYSNVVAGAHPSPEAARASSWTWATGSRRGVAEKWRKTWPIATRNPKSFSGKSIVFGRTWKLGSYIENR
jgi:hypothetical protein